VSALNWIELSIHTENEALDAVANILMEYGANGIAINDSADLTREKRDVFGELYELDQRNYPQEGIIVKAYYIDNETWPLKKEEIQNKINTLKQYGIHLGKNRLFVNKLQEEDWENEWKKYFKPAKVTDRFTIVPSWEKYKKESVNELIITIDPGMAFGTGTHPTTILSLQGLEETIRPNDIVLDVGVGSGILSIAAILLGANHVYGFDLDEVAVKSALLNRDRNHFEERITVKENDLLNGVKTKANIIISNILADILIRLVEDAWENLQEEGYFITSGIIDSKKQKVRNKLETRGFKIVKTNQHDQWISFVAQKPKNK